VAKVKKVKKFGVETANTIYMFFCPGCKCGHCFDQSWEFNQNMDKPTLSPSYVTGINDFKDKRCHSFIKNGKIRFLDDCYHDLKNKTVELEDF